MAKETVNERIKNLRHDLKMTGDEFCDKTGIDRATLSKIETGKSSPHRSTIKSISTALNVEYEWLLYGENTNQNAKSSENSLDLLAAEIEKKDREINWLRSVIDRLTGADAAMLGKDEVPGISGGLSELMMLPVNYPGTNIGLRA